MKKISIVIATYNQAGYLPVCLDSVWFQDWPEIEIIVVNDGSSDETEMVLDAYLEAVLSNRVSYAGNYREETATVERYEHLRYPSKGRDFRIIHHPGNRGLGAALNTGFKAACGTYCTFIASDDMLLPTALSDLARAMEKSNADFAYADLHIVDDDGRILRRFLLPDYSFKNAFCHWYMCGVCKLYRRTLHDRVGYYDEKIKPQDHDMYLRFAMSGARFVHVPKVLANVRIHDSDRQVDNHTPANWNKLYEESAALVVKARRYLAESI